MREELADTGTGCVKPHVADRTTRLCLTLVLGVLCLAASSVVDAHGSERIKGIKGASRSIKLAGPEGTEAQTCEVIQILDSRRKPRSYCMDVDSVVCTVRGCEVVSVRVHFDPLGGYERYELPSGGNLTKGGHQPFSVADHRKLHEVLSDPYSPLKSIGWDQITVPTAASATNNRVDGISGATALSKRNVVVVGAAYTCYTLWHWSHGEVVNAIRDMTIAAADKRDLVNYLQEKDDKYVIFGADQLRTQGIFDTRTVNAVRDVMRHGSDKVVDSALRYLAAATQATGVDHLVRCCEDKYLVANSVKRTRFLEVLRDSKPPLPAGCLDRLGSWLSDADTYYEVHLLVSLLEREKAVPRTAIEGAMSQLENQNFRIADRCHQFLKAQKLTESQQRKLKAFEDKSSNR